MHWDLSITHNFTLDIIKKVRHFCQSSKKSIVLKSERYSIFTPSLSSRNWTISKVYLSSSNPLTHTYFKIKIRFFHVWHGENSWIFFEVLESQVSSQFCLVYEFNPQYHTQLYSVNHNLTLIIKLQTFLYKFKKTPHLNT